MMIRQITLLNWEVTMHDIDRTQMESWEAEPGEFEYETYQEFEGPFNEVEEMELASQLLEVTDEAELDQFLGSLFKKASRAVGSFMKGPVGKQSVACSRASQRKLCRWQAARLDRSYQFRALARRSARPWVQPPATCSSWNWRA